MVRENKSKYALLGILSIEPMTGYDIKKTIEKSLSNFWSESYGQIYPTLKALVAEGLASSSVEEQAGKPDRQVYTLTEAGRAELGNWLSKQAEYEVGRNELLLKLFFGRLASPEQNLSQVEGFRQQQLQLLDKYARIEQWLNRSKAGDPALVYWLMTVSYGRHVSQAILEWCQETREILNSLKDKEPEK